MRLIPSDPDVETIVSRIKSGDINLQPEFQRGEVWSKPKKQRLVDSILRDWHVPPIHVIVNAKSGKQEVLDGQQRLAAIRDFVDQEFSVDGNTEPYDAALHALHGKYYSDLPENWKRRFNQFTIRLFRIVDYEASEPGELFFRLNQPTSLTAAEQRNAFFGPVREQIKAIVELLRTRGLDKDFFGFTNSRMAYDDVLARSALAVERGSISEKITGGDLIDLYRSEQPLRSKTVSITESAIQILADAKSELSDWPKFNKATLFSWLIFLIRPTLSGEQGLSSPLLAGFINYFEKARHSATFDAALGHRLLSAGISVSRMISIYENRSSSRVADVSSVILRDAALWLMFEDYSELNKMSQFGSLELHKLHAAFDDHESLGDDDLIARSLLDLGWGSLS